MAHELKNRADMDPRWQWHLNDIYASAEAFEADFAKVKDGVEAVKRIPSRLSGTPTPSIS